MSLVGQSRHCSADCLRSERRRSPTDTDCRPLEAPEQVAAPHPDSLSMQLQSTGRGDPRASARCTFVAQLDCSCLTRDDWLKVVRASA